MPVLLIRRVPVLTAMQSSRHGGARLVYRYRVRCRRHRRVVLWIGPAPIVAPWDVFTLLNGAYRIYEGQAPGTDFSNPIGPMVYGLTAIGMHLQRAPSLAAVTYGQVIFLVIVSFLAWVVTWRRLPGPYAAALTIFVAFLAVSVRPLGYLEISTRCCNREVDA